MTLPLYAVHISDGILSPAWIVGGFLILATFLAVALVRVPQELIPRLGVLTGVFFVASQVHIPLGPVSVHLILNGLMGVLLGIRCVIPIAVGLALQAFLVGHGGLITLGVNFAVMAAPGILAGSFYRFVPIGYHIIPCWFLGAATALVTVILNTLVLYFGANGDWAFIARTSVLLHLPVIGLEGTIVACVIRVLATSRPEWLGLSPDQSDSGKTSENGTSH